MARPRHLKAMTIRDAVDYRMKRYEARGAKRNTLNQKRSILERLVEVTCKENPKREVWTLTVADLKLVLDYLMGGCSEEENEARLKEKKKPRPGRRTEGSIGQAHATLRQFLDECHENEWLSLKVKLPTKESFVPATESHHENAPAEKVYLAAEAWPRLLNVAGKRHMKVRMAIALGLYCGLRASDAMKVQWKHIDWENREVRFFMVKQRKWVGLPLSEAMEDELLLWREWAEGVAGKEVQGEWYLVPNRKGSKEITGANSRMWLKRHPALYPVDFHKRSQYTTLWRDVRKVFAHPAFGFGSNEGTGTHTWRRSIAKAMELLTGDPTAVQAFLHHRSLTTTQIYTQNASGVAKMHKAMGSHLFSRPVPEKVVQLDDRRAAREQRAS